MFSASPARRQATAWATKTSAPSPPRSSALASPRSPILSMSTTSFSRPFTRSQALRRRYSRSHFLVLRATAV